MNIGKLSLNLTERKLEAFYLFLGTSLITYLNFVVALFYGNVSAGVTTDTFLLYMISAIGYALLYAVVLLSVIYLPLSIIFKRTRAISRWSYIVVAILLQCVFIVDLLVFNIYRFHINANILNMALNGGNEVFVFDISLVLKLLALLACIAIIPYLLVLYWARRQRRQKNKAVFVSLLIAIASLSTCGFGHVYAIRNQRVDIIKAMQTIPFHKAKVWDKILYFAAHDEIDQFMFQVIYGELEYPKNPITSSDSIPKYNIVYILIDSWNPRTFTEEVSPNIYHFANERADLFTQHFSTSNATHYSVNSIFYSIPTNPLYFIPEKKKRPVILDVMLEYDYQIKCFASATMVNQFTFEGIDDIQMSTEGRTPFDRDTQINKDFKSYLDKKESEGNNQPFFSLLFYDLAHALSIPEEHAQHFRPSWTSADYLSIQKAGSEEPFFNLYKNCIFYIDQLVGQVINDLEERGLLDNTIVVITGDHGQEFNENKKGYWGHYSNFSKWQLQIPFVLYYPNIEEPRKYDHLTTHNDIVPTISSRFLGVQNPIKDYSIGHDIYSEVNRYPIECGNYHSKAVLLEKYIITANNEWRLSEVTDKQLNRVSKDSVDASELNIITEQRKYYFKDNSLIIKK